MGEDNTSKTTRLVLGVTITDRGALRNALGSRRGDNVPLHVLDMRRRNEREQSRNGDHRLYAREEQ